MRTLFSIKKYVVEICRLLYNRGLVVATDGNVSARIGKNKILITPNAKSKGLVNIQDLVVIDFNGKKISGRMNPSGEYRLHTMIYKERTDVNAIIHAHPIYSTAFSVAGISLMQYVLPEVVITLGRVPTASYATLYTEELPNSVKKHIKNYDAVLLKNHGIVTVGKDIFSAYYKLEKVEHMAKIIYIAKTLGNVDLLSKKQVRKLLKVKEILKH